MITATTTKGPVTASDLGTLAEQLANLAPSGVTLLWGESRCHVPVPVGDSARAWLQSLGDALIGEEVEGGTVAQDYDHGSVFEDGGSLFVAWQMSQQANPAALGTLRPLDETHLARARAILAAAA